MAMGYYGGVDEPYDRSWPYPKSKPGDMFPKDADLTIYWPYVAQCWEEKSYVVYPDGSGAGTPILPEFYKREERRNSAS